MSLSMRGGFVASAGLVGLVASAGMADVLYDTGAPHTVVSSGAETYLGFSSGATSGSTPQRWAAVPFTMPAGGAHLDQIDVDWFIVAGSEAKNVNYIIWKRTGLTAPVDGDQVSSGVLGAYGAGIDDPRTTTVTDDWLHQYPVDITLDGGDYYFTMYADGATGTSGFSNAAWLTGGDLQDESLEQDFLWRSSSFPSPGFVPYNPGTITPGTGMTDAQDVWNTCFAMFGKPIPAPAAGSVLAVALVGAARRRRA